MRYKTVLITLITITTVAVAADRPTLDALWPNEDGKRWEYSFHIVDLQYELDVSLPAFMQLSGTAAVPGGEAQILLAEHDPVSLPPRGAVPALPPLAARIWRARPDLRTALEARYAGATCQGDWWPLLLHGGYLLKAADAIEMWQDDWTHRTWLYLEDDLGVGTSFSLQLVPELADDIWLHGTVGAVDAAVDTEAGLFSGALRMDYLIDFGVGALTNEMGAEIGSVHAEIRGHVHYAPGVGPVEMLEEYWPAVWADCGEDDCPPEVETWIGMVTSVQTLSLTRLPVADEDASWGAVKSLYR